VRVCTPAGAAAAEIPWERSICSHTGKCAAAVPIDLAEGERLVSLPYVLFVWFAPAFGFPKEKGSLLLGLQKSEILPHFWSHGCWVCYSSGVFGLNSNLKRLCDRQRDPVGVTHVAAVVKAWQMDLARSLAWKKHSLCEQPMEPQGCP